MALGDSSKQPGQGINFYFGAPEVPDSKNGKVVQTTRGRAAGGSRNNRFFNFKFPKIAWGGPIIFFTIVLFAWGYFSGPIGRSLAESAVALSRDFTTVSASGANLTVALSNVVISATRASVTLAEEFWHGVDLYDTKASVKGSRWIMHRAVAYSDTFFSSELGKLVAHIPIEHQRALLIAARGVSAAIPYTQFVEAAVCFNESYREFAFQVALLPNGYVGMQFLYTNVSFNLQWANPTWSLLDMDPSTELEGVKARLGAALRFWPEAQWQQRAFTGHELDYLLTIEPSWWLNVQFRTKNWWKGQLN